MSALGQYFGTGLQPASIELNKLKIAETVCVVARDGLLETLDLPASS